MIRVNTGEYSLSRTTATTLYVNTMVMDDCTYLYMTVKNDNTITFTDATNNTNTSTLRLMLLTNI